MNEILKDEEVEKEEVLTEKNELKNEMVQEKVKRPWQGTTWAWVNIAGYFFAGLVLCFVFMLAIIGISLEEKFGNENNFSQEFSREFNNDSDEEFAGDEDFWAVIGLVMIAFVVIFFTIFIVLDIFLIIGFFKGWKWAVITAIVFNSFGVISNLGFFIKEGGEGFFGVCLSGFLLYLAIFCVSHPFYNQKKLA